MISGILTRFLLSKKLHEKVISFSKNIFLRFMQRGRSPSPLHTPGLFHRIGEFMVDRRGKAVLCGAGIMVRIKRESDMICLISFFVCEYRD